MKKLTPILLFALLISVGCAQTGNDRKKNKINPENSGDQIGQQTSQKSDIQNIKCSLDIILQIEGDIDSLTTSKMKMFLENFSKDCRNNVEFSEVSNEVLFIVIKKYPELFVDVMCNNNSAIEKKEIYFQLSQPLHDLIPVDSIYTRINQISRECSQLDSIKKYLKIATENM